MPDLTPVFIELRKLMAPYAAQLDVRRDDASELYLDTTHLQKNKTPLFFGAVQAKSSSISVHLMPLYLAPELLASASPALLSKMHGKSCFHFKAVEPALFKELAALIEAGYARYKAQGFVP